MRRSQQTIIVYYNELIEHICFYLTIKVQSKFMLDGFYRIIITRIRLNNKHPKKSFSKTIKFYRLFPFFTLTVKVNYYFIVCQDHYHMYYFFNELKCFL